VSVTETHIHGTPMGLIQRMIDKQLGAMCSQFPALSQQNVRDDASQEAWLRVLSAAQKWEDLGYPFSSYAHQSIVWALWDFARREYRHVTRFEPSAFLPEPGRQADRNGADGPLRDLFDGLEDGDVLFLHLSGFLLKEINALYPGRKVTTQTIEAARLAAAERAA